MSEDLFGDRFAECHKGNRPIDDVEAGDVLTDDVNVGRPEFSVIIAVFAAVISERGDIV